MSEDRERTRPPQAPGCSTSSDRSNPDVSRSGEDRPDPSVARDEVTRAIPGRAFKGSLLGSLDTGLGLSLVEVRSDRTSRFRDEIVEAVWKTFPPLIQNRYEFVGPIGWGGMGVVLEARDTRLSRSVAIKGPRAPDSTPEAIKRLQRHEVSTMAALPHPNILPIHDTWDDEHGNLWCSMMLVPGERPSLEAKLQSLSKLREIDERPIAELLEIFLQICRAVGYAHGRGYVHRDLKPANVLIGPSGEVLVSDWGLAVRLDEQSTTSGLVACTPEWAAPEQLGTLGPVRSDERSDVFGLGLILFALVAGRSMSEPSARPESRCPTRLTGIERVPQRVPKELRIVVARATAHAPADRYSTVGELAEAVQRYQTGELLEGVEYTLVERWRRWVRRYPGRTVAALSLLVVLAMTTVFSVHEAKQRRAAVRTRDLAMEALRSMTDDVVEQMIGSKTALGRIELAYLESTVRQWQRFAAGQGDDEQARAIRAEGAFRIAEIRLSLGEKESSLVGHREAVSRWESLVADHPNVPSYRQLLAASIHGLGNVERDLGRWAEAERSIRAALAIREKLVSDWPSVASYRQALAMSLNRLGNLLMDLGRQVEAERAFRDGLAIREKLARESPSVPSHWRDLAASHNSLGAFLREQRRGPEAERAFRAGLLIRKDLVREHPFVPSYRNGLALSHNYLGDLLDDQGRRAEAEQAYRVGLDIWRSLVREYPSVPSYGRSLASITNSLGELLKDSGRRAEAETAFRTALNLRERLSIDFPKEIIYQVDLGGSCRNLANLQAEKGAFFESLPWYARAISILSPVVSSENRLLEARRFLLECHRGRAVALEKLERFSEALPDWNRAIELDQSASRLELEQRRTDCLRKTDLRKIEKERPSALSRSESATSTKRAVLEQLH